MLTAKRILIVVMLCVTTTGFSVSKHYCSGELVSLSVNSESESCCGSTCDNCQNLTEHLNLDITSIIQPPAYSPDIQLLIPALSKSVFDFDITTASSNNSSIGQFQPQAKLPVRTLAFRQAYLI
jgi:hypothetical protein